MSSLAVALVQGASRGLGLQVFSTTVGARILNVFRFRMAERVWVMVPTNQKTHLASLDHFIYKEKIYETV